MHSAHLNIHFYDCHAVRLSVIKSDARCTVHCASSTQSQSGLKVKLHKYFYFRFDSIRFDCMLHGVCIYMIINMLIAHLSTDGIFGVYCSHFRWCFREEKKKRHSNVCNHANSSGYICTSNSNTVCARHLQPIWFWISIRKSHMVETLEILRKGETIEIKKFSAICINGLNVIVNYTKFVELGEF